MEKLRECPCGNEAHLIFEDGIKVADPWSVECKNFDCPWVFQTFPTKEEAVKHWNTRATDPLLKEMAEAFEVIIRCLSHGLQDCKASITAKAILQKYHEQDGE